MNTHPKDNRIRAHPILSIPEEHTVEFTWNDNILKARAGEMISSALIANGIHVFGHHAKDKAPQSIFCANGQCSQCLVVADGVPVKGCITPLRAGMDIQSMEGKPTLPKDDTPVKVGPISEVEVDVLIAGAGPAGLNAALELGVAGLKVLLCDDKHDLGGKLTLQTHNFFGSVKECKAGTRGMDIAIQLAKEIEDLKNVEIWLDSPVVGAFVDGKIGVVRRGVYHLVKPKHFIIATGAREKALSFPGCDLPGVFGAGAFQTLVNRDLIRPSKRVFVIGGGNVGLIAAYHALQAGIDVVGLVEALPKVGGYKVHLDKIRRLGIPVWTSHTVAEATGKERVEHIVISRIDDKFRPIPGTEREFAVDTILVAVGLNPVNELAEEATRMGIPTIVAGDAAVIAEASAAMFSGRITARETLQGMKQDVSIPADWQELIEILRSKPGPIHEFPPPEPGDGKTFPVIRCVQEIPCNPCIESCPKGCIRLMGDNIMAIPKWQGACAGCLKCAAVCPGLAITIVDLNKDTSGKRAWVWVPWELPDGTLFEGKTVTVTKMEGEVLGEGLVRQIRTMKWMDRRSMVAVEVDSKIALDVAGIRFKEPEEGKALLEYNPIPDYDIMICLCERVTKGQIRRLIRDGVRDMNALKQVTRCGMGACQGKTCENLIRQIFREEGVPPEEVTGYVKRPFSMEVPMRAFLGEIRE